MMKEKNLQNKKFNPYQHITDKIIEALEKGVGPWVRPWDDSGAQFGLHRNAVSDHVYRGINVLLLNLVAFEKGFADPRWVTFNDAKKLGGYINKGEKHTKIVFWKCLELDDRTEGEVLEIGANKSKKVVPLLRFYRVFNIEQCSNLNLKELPKPDDGMVEGEVNSFAESILSLTTIRHGGTKAVYYSDHDFIQMPPKSAFLNINHYYATGFHEAIHWCGHESRLNRNFSQRFGDSCYAVEELVAEIGSAFLGGHVGLSFKEMRHPEYIQSWISRLKDNNKAIFATCRMAQAASDFMLEKAQIKKAEMPDDVSNL